MKEGTWKILAIIFICLFIIENIIIAWGYLAVVNEEDKINECYYDICEGYPDAWYELDVCTCYDYDNLGSLVTAKEKYMK